MRRMVTGIWHNVSALQSISFYLQWILIVLLFLGGVLQVTKLVIDRREKTLTAAAKAASERARSEHEAGLLAEMSDLKKKTAFVDPFKQPLRTGSATVEVVISSPEPLNAHFMDSGGYIALRKGQEALLIMSNTQSTGTQIGNNQILYRGVFHLDAAHPAIGKPISFLVDSDVAQVEFFQMPEGSKVIKGRAICTFNSAVRIDIPIPTQLAQKRAVITEDVPNAFAEYSERAE